KIRFKVGFDEDRALADREVPVNVSIAAGQVTSVGRFELLPAGKLTGTLVGPTGQVPADAACLKVGAIDADGYSYDGSINGQVETGTGRFTVGGLSTDPVKSLLVYDTCNDYADIGRVKLDVSVAGGETKDIGQVKMAATGKLTGKVTGPGGFALTDTSRVYATAYDSDGKQVGKTAQVNRETGMFTITEVPGGDVKRIAVHDTGRKGSYSPLQRVVDIAVAPDATVDAGVFELALHTGSITKPGKPDSPWAEALHQRVRLSSWDWYTDDGGAGVTDWIIQYSTDGSNWTTFNDGVSGSSDEVTVSGLTNGVGYWFRVAAVNSVGQGDWSDASERVVPGVQRPGEPSAPTGTPGDGRVTLSWSAPADNGGAPISDYRISYWRADGSGGWGQFNDGVSAATSATVTGLSNGVGYRFAVEATNSAGTSYRSDASVPVTPVASAPVPVSTPAAPAPAAPAPAPAPAGPAPAAQDPAGGVPSVVKAKGKGKKAVKLPKRTNAGQAVKWSSATPKVCKVVKGKLKLTKKKGLCRLTGAAPATGGFEALRQSYAIRVK
ncbi:MAG: fibronectin type III domain-containing protein, partial [Candidatus Nanopelagicales bacterium]|nr:fibronectin type III domain-containing protein [Candidatus Nanopelagicales bacterium]